MKQFTLYSCFIVLAMLSTQLPTAELISLTPYDPQVGMVKQQVWTHLTKVPGTERDYESTVRLRIADGNIIDADCKLIFPESSWRIASLEVKEYVEVLKKTDIKIYEVIYLLITNPGILASEVKFSGLWRPWLGSHVHQEGRGIDLAYIRSSNGDGVIFNYNTSKAENDFGARMRTALTGYQCINQYLSPWFMCSPANKCKVNERKTNVEKIHLDHLHLTLSP